MPTAAQVWGKKKKKSSGKTPKLGEPASKSKPKPKSTTRSSKQLAEEKIIETPAKKKPETQAKKVETVAKENRFQENGKRPAEKRKSEAPSKKVENGFHENGKRPAENGKLIETPAKKRKSEPPSKKVETKENGCHENGINGNDLAEEEIGDIDEKTLKDLLACFNLAMVPDELPCRDDETRQIRDFIEGNLNAGTSGCKYISGVPGTGKTASVRLVMQQLEKLKRKLPDFVFVELNGMLVSDPKQIFVMFYKALQGKKGFFNDKPKRASIRISPAAAMKSLDRLFEISDSSRPAIVLLLDEIDALVTKRQQHLYRILDWSTQEGAKLTVVAVANTLDLPERVLSNRNHSRMGLHRLCFKPYDHKQIVDILMSRLRKKPDAVDKDATEFIARKIASVSGDIRRAFEICRMAVEAALSALDPTDQIQSSTKRKSQRQRRCGHITREHVMQALKKIQMNIKVQAIKHASTQEKLLLEATVMEYRRAGLEEMPFDKIWHHYRNICHEKDARELPIDELLDITNRLAECHLLTSVVSASDGRQDFTGKYKLNANPGDVDIALKDESEF